MFSVLHDKVSFRVAPVASNDGEFLEELLKNLHTTGALMAGEPLVPLYFSRPGIS
jgi:hypothetical protein